MEEKMIYDAELESVSGGAEERQGGIRCPYCGEQVRLPLSIITRERYGKCPHCEQSFKVDAMTAARFRFMLEMEAQRAAENQK